MQMQVQRLELDGYFGTLAASISPSQGRGPVSQWPHPQVPEPHDALASPQVADAGNTQPETSVCAENSVKLRHAMLSLAALTGTRPSECGHRALTHAAGGCCARCQQCDKDLSRLCSVDWRMR